MSHSGVPGASLLSNSPKYNPLGTIGTMLPDIGAAAGEYFAPGNPFSTAILATKGGFDLSQGNTLGGLANLAGSALSGATGLGAFGDAGAATSAGSGTAATTGDAAGNFGSSLSDFASSPSLAGAGNVASAAGSDISSGLGSVGTGISSAYNSVLNALGLGGASSAAGAGAAAGDTGSLNAISGLTSGAGSVPVSGVAGAAGGISPDLAAQLATGANAANGAGAFTSLPAGFSAAPSIEAGAGAAGGGINGLLAAHQYLSLGGGLLGSQLLAPYLSKLTGGGLTSEQQSMLSNAQGALGDENQLISSEQTGVLPAGAQAAVNQALASDIANIKSRYAATGQSGSSAEAQDIANAQQQSAASAFSSAQQAAQTGLSELGLTQGVYSSLVQDQLNQQQQLQNAFSGLFNALGVGTALKSAA